MDAKLRWRCRRGMKELDVLLLKYLEQHYPTAAVEERRAFTDLLELPDPELWAYFSGRSKPIEPIYSRLIERIVAA